MFNSHVCALDIGTHKISACVAQIKKKKIVSLEFESVSSKGISKGSLVDSVNLISAIGQVLKHLKAKSGVAIKFLHVNISGQDVVTKHSRAIIPLTERGNKVITPSDIQKVNEQAQVLGSNLEEEILHKIPFSYAIDSKSNLLNPLGLYSHKLEVDLYLICAHVATLQSLTHAVNQAGYEIKDFCFSGLATSEVVFNEEHFRGMTVLCDIGSDITEIMIFNDGSLTQIEILTMGGNDLTVALKESLHIAYDFAEDIKISYGIIGEADHLKEDKEILIKKDNSYQPIKQREVCQILTVQAKEICQTIKQVIERNVSCAQIHNVVVCGRTILQEGFLEMLESTLQMRAQLGRIQNQELMPFVKNNDSLSGQKYLAYITSLGMLVLAQHEYRPTIFTAQQPVKNPFLKVMHKVKDVYQEYF